MCQQALEHNLVNKSEQIKTRKKQQRASPKAEAQHS
jgi:hypothetical protein